MTTLIDPANNRRRAFLYPTWILLACLLSSPSGAEPIPSQMPAASPAHAASVRFAVIGDYGSGKQGEADVANLIAGWHPDFILTTGDNRYHDQSYERVVGYYFCDFLKDARPSTRCKGGEAKINAFFPSLGNHDYREGGGVKEYLGYFTLPGKNFPSGSGNERYYDFVRGPVHFFVLNSNPQEPDGNGADSRQAAWLKQRLSASARPWQVVYFHHPPYSSGDHGPHRRMQWPFGKWGADAVLSGHDHTYERLEVEGTPYFVNGLGGKSRYGFAAPLPQSKVRYNDDYGAMLIDADDTRMRFRFINRKGMVIDDYTLRRPPATR